MLILKKQNKNKKTTLIVWWNLQSCFFGHKSSSPQVTSLMNKAVFPFPTNICCLGIDFQLCAAKPEYGKQHY